MKKTYQSLRRVITLLLCGAMLLSLAACGGKDSPSGSSGSESDKIVIGYIDALTGEAAVWGLVGKYTLEMLVEETNANGGLLGKQIVLKTYDNRGDPVETTNAARKAIQSTR